MDKSGSGDGVSRSSDSGGDGGGDPEVTAITRKLNTTGDTLGAIQALEQLIIERTGAIPIIRTDASAPTTAGRVVGAADVSRPADPEDPEIDWSLPSPPHVDGEPTFSPWVDPEAIAAAQDDAPAPSYSDVTTQVFAVFSAPEPEPEPQPQPQPESAPAPAAGPIPLPIPLAGPTGSLDVALPSPLDDLDDDDVIDDADHASLAGLVPLASVQQPATPPGPTAAPAPAAAPDEQPPKRRRFWPFGRR